ncbi:MAG TPA: hypothetical protein VFW25_15240 [Silvibacterium sp.]|nr:hypothetical protein [Silvibacterium sp.]
MNRSGFQIGTNPVDLVHFKRSVIAGAQQPANCVKPISNQIPISHSFQTPEKFTTNAVELLGIDKIEIETI